MNILRLNKDIKLFYTIENFLLDDEIEEIFNLCENKKFLEAEIDNDQLISKNKNYLNYKINQNSGVVKRIRESNIKWIVWEKDSEWLFKKIIKCINQVNLDNYGYILKFVENFQFTEYNSKQNSFYSKHVDQKNKYDIKSFLDIRKLSFTIQLSDFCDYEGGDLRFYIGKKSIYTNKEEYVVAKKNKGSITFFPSDILHEVTPVTKGTRYSLVSWVQGPNLL